ncbi:hypothetical protein GWK41_05835 [Persephonella atlantica]|uniref:Uncharacterized protein n=1 Tax=Persephonella atlantica TaxID=2699429 RepID=A0ABS1GI18_9AQUI|nr:hypothetical protein [Persephonella atlantica]MBK3332581.1 hypothetical protein [Persephonella atlantica]
MKRISFIVLVIWAVIFIIGWNVSKLFPDYQFFSLYGFQIDAKILITFLLQILAVGGYFHFSQKENLKNAFLRSFIFNFLIYMVYFLLIWRANTV